VHRLDGDNGVSVTIVDADNRVIRHWPEWK
jgi:hypothetical protein